MDIYSSDTDLFGFTASYNAKRLLDDSLDRTRWACEELNKGLVLKSIGNVLLARIESAAAFSFVALSATFLALIDILLTPCLLTIAATAKIVSLISSSESVQRFSQDCSHAMRRILKIHLAAIPILFLFLSASGINTFLPGVLNPQSGVFHSIHDFAESLGPLQRIRAIIPGKCDIVGAEKKLSTLEEAEDYFRALSSQNYLKKVEASSLTHHYTYSR